MEKIKREKAGNCLPDFQVCLSCDVEKLESKLYDLQKDVDDACRDKGEVLEKWDAMERQRDEAVKLIKWINEGSNVYRHSKVNQWCKGFLQSITAESREIIE